MFRWLLALALALVPIGSAGAQSLFGGPQEWGPNGNGTLDHEDDLQWVLFHQTHIVADQARGIFHATFSPAERQQDNRPFSITGYMLPVDTRTNSPHFVLTRRSAGCPFCPPNEPTEAMEVFATRPIQYTQSPVTVSGTLHLMAASEQGLFFRLTGATVQ